MSDYINIDKVAKMIWCDFCGIGIRDCHNKCGDYKSTLEKLSTMQKPDAVEVVRCRDCVHLYHRDRKYVCGAKRCSETVLDGYCHYGKREERR